MNFTKDSLNSIVIDIEFLLISVVQGVAIGALATNALIPINTLQFEYWPYIISAFLFILIFWSQAIIHSISFIDWPLDLNHNFLYLLASLVEVLAFSQITNPIGWYIYNFAFLLIVGVLYYVDLKLIKRHKEDFNKNDHTKELYKHILASQINEFKTLIPLGLVFNLMAAFLLYSYPQNFNQGMFHYLIIGLQIFFSVVGLVVASKNFKERILLINNTISEGLVKSLMKKFQG